MAATQPPDQRQVVVRLDPLGGRLHAERGREADDRRDDRRVHAVRVGGAEHEALVDLDLVERRLLQIAERRIAGTEIVERQPRSEEHTSELQSLMRISYAVFCLKKKKKHTYITKKIKSNPTPI